MLMAFISQKLGKKTAATGESIEPHEVWMPEDFVHLLPGFAMPEYQRNNPKEGVPKLDFNPVALRGIYQDVIEGFVEDALWDEIAPIFSNIAATIGAKDL